MIPEYSFIDDEDGFQALIGLSPRMLGFDTEFTRERTFNPIPELLQVSVGGRIVIIDLRAGLPMERIKHWFQQDGIVRIAHSISNDIEVLNEVFQDEIGVIEDTQLALAFLHTGQMQSYAKLVKREFGVTLDKSMQRSRWSSRPLSHAQLDYAALDIAHLNDLWIVLEEQLQETGRLDWYLEERQRLQAPNAQDPNLVAGNASRLMKLSERGLQFLTLLDAWRTKRASSMDIPKNWVLSRDQLFQLANERSLTDQAMRKALSSKQVDRHRRKLQELHRRAKHASQTSEPLAPKQLRKTVRALGDQCNALADQLNVCYEVLGSNKDLLFAIRAYLSDGELPSWFGTWRTQLIGDATRQAADKFARENAFAK